MKFECIKCEYITENKSNYNKHLKSVGHIEKCIIVQNNKKSDLKLTQKGMIDNITISEPKVIPKVIQKIMCKYCNATFSYIKNLKKHMEICQEKDSVVDDLQRENLELKRQIEDLSKRLIGTEKQLDTKDKLIENVVSSKNKDIEFLKGMTTKAGNIAEKSLDVFNKIF